MVVMLDSDHKVLEKALPISSMKHFRRFNCFEVPVMREGHPVLSKFRVVGDSREPSKIYRLKCMTPQPEGNSAC